MKRFLKSFRYGHRGFTLIELLIVVAILGVMALVIVPNVGKFFGKGTLEAANTEAATVKTAAIAYAIDVGRDVAGTVGPARDVGTGDGAGIMAYIDGNLKAKYTINTSDTTCIITAALATCDTCWGTTDLGEWDTASCQWGPPGWTPTP